MPLLPETLALIEADEAYGAQLAAVLRAQGCEVTLFADSDDFLVSEAPYGFGFYVVNLQQSGVDGAGLIRLLRRRTQVGIVAVSAPEFDGALRAALLAGADMHLTCPVDSDDLMLAVAAVYRRTSAPRTIPTWTLDLGKQRLLTPAGHAIALSEADVTVLRAFEGQASTIVSRAELCTRFGRSADTENENWLHATIYRLRRRIERATVEPLPLQAQPRLGYVFRGRLEVC